MSTNYADPITQPQRNYLRNLIEGRDVTREHQVLYATIATKKEASDLIGELKQLPFKASKKEQAQIKPGYYILTDSFAGQGEVVFEVVLSKKGFPYAKQLVPTTDSKGKAKGRWEYAPGAAKHFVEMTPLSAAQAGVMSKAYGFCCICGKTLTVKASIDKGIGPQCASRLGY